MPSASEPMADNGLSTLRVLVSFKCQSADSAVLLSDPMKMRENNITRHLFSVVAWVVSVLCYSVRFVSFSSRCVYTYNYPTVFTTPGPAVQIT